MRGDYSSAIGALSAGSHTHPILSKWVWMPPTGRKISGMLPLAYNGPLEFNGPLATERLRVRLMTPADTDAIFSYQSRPDVCEYLLYAPRDRATVAEKVLEASTLTRLEHDGDFLQLAVERTADHTVVGELYFSLVSVEHEYAEIGWIFDPDHHGNGYAREAAHALLAVAFGRWKLHRVVAELTPQNIASVRLCHRLGMREEAYFVKNMLIKGRWEDTGVYALLRSEWDARRPSG